MKNETPFIRDKSIDFLRGIAVLLVLFFHFPLIGWLNKMGWVGVDLFFVLSGFLVSGLLFKEYQKNGRVNATRFLIRRGFKIYPLFYLFIGLTFILRLLLNEGFSLKETVGELLFIRNYTGGYWVHTWSLSVEEHFYFLLIAGVVLLIRSKVLNDRINITRGFMAIIILCFLSRTLNIVMEKQLDTNIFTCFWARYVHTHNRLDSLLAGTLIAYYFHLHRTVFDTLASRFRKYLLPVFVLLVAPALVWSPSHWFIGSVGYTCLYVGFGALLIYFISTNNIQQRLEKTLGRYLVSAIAYCGMCSYPIYLWHLMVREYCVNRLPGWVPAHGVIGFVIYFTLSIGIGILLFKYVETYFIKLRESWSPRLIIWQASRSSRQLSSI